MKKTVLAIDLGASSGRAILGEYEDGNLRLEEISRFSYEPMILNGKMHWDIDSIFKSIKNAISKAGDEYSIDSLAIDTWGVDYGLLDKRGRLIENPVHYRDTRTRGMLEKITKLIPKKELYQMSGNQLMEINTLFQLQATAIHEPKIFSKAQTLLLMPDLLNYLLTGEKKTEMSIASTTGLLSPVTKDWNFSLIDKLGFPRHLFTEIVKEGELIGVVKSSLSLPSVPVYHVCSHDTASAFVSATGNQDHLFVSCGTWSLIGVEQNKPVVNEKAYRYNLTNESGVDGTTRLLKNMTGLWMIQELRRQFTRSGKSYTYSDMERLARAAKGFQSFIDTEDARFLGADQMVNLIHRFLEETMQPIPKTDGELIRMVYESLAFRYKVTFLEIMDTLDKRFTAIDMVGGGTQSEVLCEMVANVSGLDVFAGAVEATAFGNISVQLIQHGCFAGLDDARNQIKEWSDIKRYQPQCFKEWEQQFEHYKQVVGLQLQT